MAIKVFTSKNCSPCHEVDRLIHEGKFAGEVELVDIETDEGFNQFKKEVLSFGDGAVPSAYKDGQRCVISITEDDHLIFNCPTDPPASEKD
jgi:predicted thioredoxin/glutaredoxin